MHIYLSDNCNIIRDDENAASQNRIEIQALIDAAELAGGGIVIFDNAGTYYVDAVGSIALNGKSNVTLRGIGRGAVLKLASFVQGHLVSHFNTDNACVENLSLDGNREAFAKGGLGVHVIRTSGGSRNFRVKDCYIRGGAYYGIGMQWATASMQPDIGFRLIDNTIEDCGGWSAATTADEDFGDGIDIKFGRDGLISGNDIYDVAQRGIDVRGTNIRVIGNMVQNSGSTGIAIRGNSGPSGYRITNPGKITCVGNRVLSAGENGICAFEDATSQDEGRYTITGNGVEGCTGKGIAVAGPASLMRAIIAGNCSRSNSGGNISVPSGYDRVVVGSNQTA